MLTSQNSPKAKYHPPYLYSFLLLFFWLLSTKTFFCYSSSLKDDQKRTTAVHISHGKRIMNGKQQLKASGLYNNNNVINIVEQRQGLRRKLFYISVLSLELTRHKLDWEVAGKQ